MTIYNQKELWFRMRHGGGVARRAVDPPRQSAVLPQAFQISAWLSCQSSSGPRQLRHRRTTDDHGRTRDRPGTGSGRTRNFDGTKKHQTKIGKNCSLGANSVLIAPVNLEDSVTTGAGSVINKNVEKDSLAISRVKQINIKNWKRNKKK